MHSAINVLKDKNLIQSIGQHYWEALVNPLDSVDLQQKFFYRNKALTLEDLIWYMEDPTDLTVANIFVRRGLLHVYERARAVAEDRKPTAPSNSEIKAMLIHMAEEIRMYHDLLMQIITTDSLFAPLSKFDFKEVFGQFSAKTMHYAELDLLQFQKAWNNGINSRGYNKDIRNIKPDVVSNDNYIEWDDPQDPKESK